MSRPGRAGSPHIPKGIPGKDEPNKYDKRYDYSENRRAFLNLPGTSFILFTNEQGDEEDGGNKAAPNITIKIAKSNAGAVVFNLTLLRSDELAALREFFLMATSTGLPATDVMDTQAEKELDNGIDSDPRLYREVPRLFVREGEKFDHHPGLRRGHEWDDRFPSYEQSAGVGFAKRGRRSSIPKQGPTDVPANDSETEAGGD